MEKKELELFALRLVECMEIAGVSEADLAAELKLDTTKSVKKWTKAEGWPQFGRIVKIAALLGITVEWLITGAGVRHPMNDKAEEFCATSNPEREALQRFRQLSEKNKKLALDLMAAMEPEKLMPAPKPPHPRT